MAGGKRLTLFVNGLTRKVRQRAAKTHAPPAMPMNVLSVLSLCREMNSPSATAHKMPSILSRSEAHGGASTTGNGLTSHRFWPTEPFGLGLDTFVLEEVNWWNETSQSTSLLFVQRYIRAAFRYSA